MPVTVEAVTLDTKTFEVNELLCYMQQKGKILPFDDLVRLCADFYTMDEIDNARLLLIKDASKSRLGKLKGAVKDVATRSVAALLKVCLDTSVKLPLFAAMNLARLPPVGVEHVDVSALMQEIVALRHEVRAVGIVRAEMQELRNCVQQLSEKSLCPATGQSVVHVTVDDAQLVAEDTSVLSTGSFVKNISPVDTQQMTSAQIVSRAVQSGSLACTAVKKRLCRAQS